LLKEETKRLTVESTKKPSTVAIRAPIDDLSIYFPQRDWFVNGMRPLLAVKSVEVVRFGSSTMERGLRPRLVIRHHRQFMAEGLGEAQPPAILPRSFHPLTPIVLPFKESDRARIAWADGVSPSSRLNRTACKGRAHYTGVISVAAITVETSASVAQAQAPLAPFEALTSNVSTCSTTIWAQFCGLVQPQKHVYRAPGCGSQIIK